MLKLSFFALVDTLSETVVNVFYARNLDHAKLIVRNGLKDNKSFDSDSLKTLKLLQVSEELSVHNDYDTINAIFGVHDKGFSVVNLFEE